MQPRASYLYQLPNSLEIILAVFAWMAAPGLLRELGRAEGEGEGRATGIRGKSWHASGSQGGGHCNYPHLWKGTSGQQPRDEGPCSRALQAAAATAAMGSLPAQPCVCCITQLGLRCQLLFSCHSLQMGPQAPFEAHTGAIPSKAGSQSGAGSGGTHRALRRYFSNN